MQLGIIGLPNVGKSSLFNALTKGCVPCSNYPFCTIETNIGIAMVPDERLKLLNEIYCPQKVTPAVIKFLDIAGLIKGASKGEGLGNKFLAHIREVDAIIHIIRCFSGEKVVNISENINPIRDLEIVNTELLLADLEMVERKIDGIKQKLKTNAKELRRELELLSNIKAHLAKGEFLYSFYSPLELNKYNFLTTKPVLYIINVDEKDMQSFAYASKVKEYVREKQKAEVLDICVKLELEIIQLGKDEGEKFAQEFRSELGIKKNGLKQLIWASFRLLNLITFFTVVGKEVRAWAVPADTVACKAAGYVHSDMERGFIRAEVFTFKKLERYKNEKILHNAGLIRIEGKDYKIQDGDIVHFRFNV